MEEEYKKAIDLLQRGEIDSLISYIDSILKNKPALNWKLAFATLYLDCAENIKVNIKRIDEAGLLIIKALNIYKKYKNEEAYSQFFILNKARAAGLQYDLEHFSLLSSIQKSGILDYTKIGSIYDIEKSLITAISLYREGAKNNIINQNEKHQINNNLALNLSRAGRYIEALELLDKNISTNPESWESLASYGDLLSTFIEISLIPSSPSLHLNVCEYYLRALEANPHLNAHNNIRKHLIVNANKLKSFGYDLNAKTLKQNRIEEDKEFQLLNQFRKFTLTNSLSLNEHSIYCKCNEAKIDNLKIGNQAGTTHIHANDKLMELDGYVNRILSEFCYSRFLYFNHISGISTNPEDVEFSNFSTHIDEVGYRIEQLRSSYRLIYSVLDKIMNGIFILFNLKREDNDYFESFFSKRRSDLKNISNIHLAAIFSISLELNQGNGTFENFKKIRNQMEHEYLPVSNHNSQSKTTHELETFTFDLLKLTRSAIFSFVFLIRTETII